MDDKPEKKKPMTDEERLQLAEKLDRELDEFIDKLPRKRYEDGWPEDRWEEEMEKHPFFMKKIPEPGEELHPLYEGLQKLKYDPEENEPDELAVAYKDDGNFNFKHKNYRLAILSYTEGIKIKCGKPDIESSLLNNRAAAHYFLKNFRSSLRDCELALKINPDYEKALIRAANCCFEMRQFEKGLEYCDKILQKDKENNVILELRKKCTNAAKLKSRDERKKEMDAKKKRQDEEKLLQEIVNRGVQLEAGCNALDKLEPGIPELVHHRVHLDETNCLVWPVILIYPEHMTVDYIQEFHEKNTLYEQIATVFEEPSEWDKENKYKVDVINVYSEGIGGKTIKIDINKTLEQVLKLKNFIVKGGTPSFLLLVRDSPAEARFLQKQNV